MKVNVMENNKPGLENLLILEANDRVIYPYKEFEFPFKATLSFHKLIDYIKTAAQNTNKIRRSFASSILNEIDKYPELNKTISDNLILEEHKELLHSMMMFVFPDSFWEKQTFAASTPYLTNIFYTSPKFRETIKITDGDIDTELNIDKESFNFGKNVGAFAAILNKFYGLNLNFDFPLVHKIPDPITGLDRYYKMNIADEFVDIIVKGKLKHLSAEDLEKIRTNIYNLNYLAEIIEPDNFEFSGFIVMNAINITDTEILSSIKKDLIQRDTITTTDGFLKIQHKLRSLLRCQSVLLGLAVYPDCSDTLIQYGHKIGNSFLMNEKHVSKISSIKKSIYEYSFENRKAIIIEDLTKYSSDSNIEGELIKQGIINILIAPLIYNDETVGVIELGCSVPGMINRINSLKLREVFPLLAMAVGRSREEINNKIEAIIKEKCTAIHPSLEWRFRNAAMNLLQNEEKGEQAEMKEIIFHDVYPLYGLSDIRNSSVHRNESIKEDLIENLNLAKDVVLEARRHKDLKILDEVKYKIEKKVNSLQYGISTADEAEVLKFLKTKIIPLFEHLKNYNKNVQDAINGYTKSLDEKLGFVYRRRKSYEESATQINNMISSYLDEEQAKIQQIFPHYFEKYKTDGVDYNIYIGSSLVENKLFNKIYLKNLRLWQLIIMCGIVRKSADLEKTLSTPLETAHLILVQDTPLSVRFRFDEKKFDVDGAYNVRYEIMKKRIDKAEIKGKEERLTQPGKIAVVYSQSTEAQEYSEYIEYLQSIDYLKNEVEELELEELQGVKGLKSLRVSVNLNNMHLKDKIDNEKIKKAINHLSAN